MIPRTFIFSFLLLGTTPAAMAFFPIDTVTLGGVQVTAERHRLFREGTSSYHFDSLTMARFTGLSLSEMISQSLPVPVMSYGGQGSLSAILLRGTTSAQTTVAWNGFPVNSLTAGSADLSLVPAGMVTDISVNAGIPGSLLGYGTIGGVVFLSNTPDFDNRWFVRGQASAGSFHSSLQTVNAMAGTEKIQVQATLFRQQAENDFLFSDSYKPGEPRLRQSHNRLMHYGFSQAAFLRLPRDQQLEMGVWHQERLKEIPPIMGSYEPGTAAQNDSVTRLYAGYTRRFEHALLKLRSAYFDEYLHYTDRQDPADQTYSIDSRIRTRQLLATVEYRTYLTAHLLADAGMTGSLHTADVESYGGMVRETRQGLFGGIRISYPLWTANLTVLKEWVSRHDPPVQLALNGQLTLLPGRLSLRAKLANHYRVPSMNDKYWKPGGDPALRPERGGGGEAGLSLSLPLGGTAVDRLETELTTFSFLVNDWIQWVPGLPFWHAVNYQRVWARGLESRLSAGGSLHGLRWALSAGYSYTRSEPLTLGEDTDLQLPYLPLHTATASLLLQTGGFTLSWTHSYQGKRFSTADNAGSFAVPPCYLAHLYAGWSRGRGSLRPELSVRVNNLFDHSYESVRSVAMPGRSLTLNMVLTCTKREEKK